MLRLHCDLVIADDSARFSMPISSISALVPEAEQARCCFRGLPEGAAPRATCCSPSHLTPMRRQAIGLVSHRAEPGQLEDAGLGRNCRALLLAEAARSACVRPSDCFGAAASGTRCSNG